MIGHRSTSQHCRQRRGSTIILTMVFLALFATLAVAFSAASNMNLQQAKNYQGAHLSQLATESGTAYMLSALRGMSIPAGEAEDDLLTAVANRLAADMDGTANLGTGEITFDGTTVRTPMIPIDASGQSFQAAITEELDGSLTLDIQGHWGNCSRGVRLSIVPAQGSWGVFDYGIASKSKIVMTGNAKVLGVNDPKEADVLSATYSDPEAVRLAGNCDIDGDISTSNPASFVTLIGNPSIGGETSMAAMAAHIHTGIGDVEFPEIDPSVFEPYAMNIINSSSQVTGNKTFENIRIKAGTNPTFGGNITIKGVVFIEQPNVVRFTGNLNLTGVIVTEDAGDDAFEDNFIQFTGNMSCQGVEALPDLPQFAELRTKPGSMLLAPGFGVKFTGNFNTVNGTMAADQFKFTGNAGGTVAGSIICYSDSDFTLTGNSTMKIDRSQYGRVPPGFESSYELVADATSYREY